LCISGRWEGGGGDFYANYYFNLKKKTSYDYIIFIFKLTILN
jgi:hypothetical protein